MFFNGSSRKRRRGVGQALVEFCLVIPIFMTLIVSILEFSFLLTVKSALTTAAQDGAQIGAQLGNTVNADWYILNQIEKDMGPPVDKTRIVRVSIFKTDLYGRNLGSNHYTRTGSWTLNSVTIPWGPIGGGGGWTENSRCGVMLGCGGGSTGVDWLGVTITYQYGWMTPLPGLIGLGGAGPTMVQTSTTRLEPIQ